MSEREQSPLPDDEQIAQSLKAEVAAFVPEQILAPEKAAHIRDALLNGLEYIDRDTRKELRFWNRFQRNRIRKQYGIPPVDTEAIIAANYWPIEDVARSFLTNPLPKQRWQYDSEKIPASSLEKAKAAVADTINWWDVLSIPQRQALSQVVGLNLEAGENYIPPADKRPHIILQGQPMSVPRRIGFPRKFYPALTYVGDEGGGVKGYGITAIPVRQARFLGKRT